MKSLLPPPGVNDSFIGAGSPPAPSAPRPPSVSAAVVDDGHATPTLDSPLDSADILDNDPADEGCPPDIMANSRVANAAGAALRARHPHEAADYRSPAPSTQVPSGRNVTPNTYVPSFFSRSPPTLRQTTIAESLGSGGNSLGHGGAASLGCGGNSLDCSGAAGKPNDVTVPTMGGPIITP